MKLPIHSLAILAALLAVVSPAAATPADAATPLLSAVRSQAKVPFGPEFSNLDGLTSNITQDPGNVCFDAIEETIFLRGETVAFNLFWDDEVDSPPGAQSYEVTIGLIVGLSPILLGPFNVEFDLSGFDAGEVVTLCGVVSLDVPEMPQIEQDVVIDWGGRVEDLADPPARLVGILGTINIAEPGQ